MSLLQALLSVFDKRYRTVKSGSKVLARFDAIRSIDVTHYRHTEDRPEHWAVGLNLEGWFASIMIGKTRIDVDASIAAARISAVTDKAVRCL